MEQATPSPRVLLILPCFNEAGAIAALLQEACATVPEFDLLVIDDGSTDATATAAAAHAPVVRLLANLGIGGAVQTGIKYAHAHGYDYCAQMDGDGQHPPAEYRKLLASALHSGADITIGSRYADLVSFRSTVMRRMGGRLISKTLYLFCGRLRVSDPTSGMRLLNRRAMAYFAAHYPVDYPEPISLAWAVREGLSVAEVPVVMRERQVGSSSLSGLRKSLSYMMRVIGYVLVASLQNRRRLALSPDATASLQIREDER